MVYRIMKHLNLPFAYHRLTLPHIISSLTKRTGLSRSGIRQVDWLLHRYSSNLSFDQTGKMLRLAGRSSTVTHQMTYEIRVLYKSDPVADNLNLRKVSIWLRLTVAMLLGFSWLEDCYLYGI